MANVIDVAENILSRAGQMSTWKLQKLVYYCQAWNAVWEDARLFDARIEAWANGPVCPGLHEAHRGRFTVRTVRGDADALSEVEVENIGIVLDFYGKYNGQQLSDLTHEEEPWRRAREGLSPRERSDREITVESLAEYYGSL